MAKLSELLDIDTIKLRNHLKENNIQFTKLSIDMGYDKSYVSALVNNKFKISPQAYKLMCLLLNVPESMFIKKQEPATPAADQRTKTVFRPVAPEQMDALISAINSQVEVLDRLYTMLDTKLDGIVSLGIPLGRLNNNVYDFAVFSGMPETRPRRTNKEDN